MKTLFRSVATKVSNAAGNPLTFCAAILIIVLWASSGPAFGFSDTWQLIINTGTTIVTFLMVFLIQNTQNRDSKAMQLKLDELIRATTARNTFIDIEDLNDDELLWLNNEFKRIHQSKPDPAIEKLRAKIEMARNQRLTIRKQAMNVAGQVVSTLMGPLNAINGSGSGKEVPKKPIKKL